MKTVAPRRAIGYRTPPMTPRYLWPLLLAAAALAGSRAAACMFPFVAVAVAAAATLPPRQALGAAVLAWALNQAVGFGFMGYPTDATTLAWGPALLAGTLAALAAARAALSAPWPAPVRLAAAFALGVAGYEAVLYAAALALGGTENFTGAIVAEVALTNAGAVALLLALHAALAAAAPARALPRRAG